MTGKTPYGQAGGPIAVSQNTEKRKRDSMRGKGCLRIRHATIATPSGLIEGDCVIEDGTIAAVGGSCHPEGDDRYEVLDAKGGLLCPGFIDLHVHGGAGHDFSDADGNGAEEIVRFHQQHGTTSLVASVVPGPLEAMARALDVLAEPPISGVVGIHLEGPFVSRHRKGALNEEWLREVDTAAFRRLVQGREDHIAVVTLAPELEGSGELIRAIGEIGAVPAIGHTACSFDQACAAVEEGATHFTHLFNAMTGLQHREPGVVGAALRYDTTTMELIADGIHVHPWVIAFVLERVGSSKRPGRACLVTDAIRATGMKDGEYTLGGLDVTVAGSVARLSDGTLAGSTLTMDQALRNVMEYAGLGVTEALPLVTANPAVILGLGQRKGAIVEGADGDLVLLDADATVCATVRMGAIVFQREC